MLHDLTGKSVLIVDDEQGIRKLFKLEFEDFSADVSLAESGQTAMALLREKQFDIVVTDMKMPDGDGIWLLSQMNEELDQIPQIYLCTGYSDYPSEYTEELGVIKTFQKPFDFETVVSEIIKYNQIKEQQNQP